MMRAALAVAALATAQMPGAGQSPAAPRPARPASVPIAGLGARRAPVDGKAASAILTIAPRGIDMDVLRKLHRPYFPSPVQLVDERPTAITREPAYAGRPRYGAIRLGNGPRAVTLFAVDEPKGGRGRAYFDLNQNGDLTDDGAPDWGKATDNEGITYYERELTLHASWGDALTETEGAGYTVLLYKRHGDPRAFEVRLSARTGTVDVEGKPVTVTLAENTSDAIFTVPRRGDRTRRAVWLVVERSGKDGAKSLEALDLSEPFQLEGRWFEASPSVSGAEITLAPAAAPGTPPAAAAPPVPRPALLKVGARAPDFTVQTPDGKPIRLSDFRGKTVILDFWATWCGPCQASMPGLERIYQQVKGQNVVVFSVNVWDAKDPFDAWILKNAGARYSFTFGFDPAGRDPKTGVAASKYGVTGIPTLFIIDPSGSVAATVIGSGNEKPIVAALEKLGARATVE